MYAPGFAGAISTVRLHGGAGFTHHTHRYSVAPVASGREALYDSLPLFLYLVILVPSFLKPTDSLFFFFFETSEQAVILKGSLFLQCFEQVKPSIILRPE